ncbi:MAG: hypothetical protein P4L31_06110, partial [Candidatus Babeliales bacterium]|nr:hypothetical protein [Candidatus Babeliales bacterium]
HDWLFPAPQTSPPLSFANLNPQNGFQYAGIPHKGIISPEIKKQFVTAPSPDKWAYPAPGDWKKGPAAQFFQSKSGKELACIAAGIGVGAGAYYFGVGAIASEACKTFILGTQLRLAVENGSLVTIRGVTMGAEAAQRVQPMVNSQSLLTAGQIQSFLAREGYTAFVAGEGMVAQNLNRLLGPGGNVIARVGNNVKLFENNASHIFTKEHLILDTPANRELLSKTASDAKNFLGVDKYGTEWYGKILPDGKQMWTQVRDGFIRNAGVNESVKVFDKDTGLSRNLSAINESTKNI